MQRRTPRQNRGRVGGNLSPLSFKATQLSGCILWLRSDATNIAIGTGVSQWNDLSSKGYNVTQATGSKQPTYNASDANYNGRPTLSFSSAALSALQSGAITNVNQPYTIIVVGEFTSAGGTIVQGTVPSGGLFFGASQNLEGYAGTILNSAGTVSSKCVLAGIFNTTTTLYVNNSQTAVASGSAGSGLLGGVIIVGSGGLGGNTSGKCAEVMAYSRALSSSELHQVFGYTSALYGISGVS